MAMEESILKTVRQFIGPSASYDVFDNTLLIHVNSAFSRLCQLGVGPSTPFRVCDESTTWSDFMHPDDMPPDVIEYICIQTRLMFDTPGNSTTTNSLKEQAAKLEWLLKEVARFGY